MTKPKHSQQLYEQTLHHALPDMLPLCNPHLISLGRTAGDWAACSQKAQLVLGDSLLQEVHRPFSVAGETAKTAVGVIRYNLGLEAALYAAL